MVLAAEEHATSREGATTTVDVRGVVKTYGSAKALDAVDLSVPAGQVCGLLGPNGAGKTTLLRCILGLVRPNAGSVTVMGAAPGSSAALASTGALIETAAFAPGLSGRANLEVLARARGVGRSEVDRVLELLDLADTGKKAVRHYSMGMKQRLGVAAAVLGSPDLLILDEPTNGLDPEGVVAMRQVIRTLAADGATLLVSSHVLSEVEQVCDAVVVLQKGRVVASGAVSALTGTEPDHVELIIRAEPLPLAEETLRESPLVRDVRSVTDDQGSALRCRVAHADAAQVGRLLSERGASIVEITRAKRHLEDVFLDLTSEVAPS